MSRQWQNYGRTFVADGRIHFLSVPFAVKFAKLLRERIRQKDVFIFTVFSERAGIVLQYGTVCTGK